MRSEGRIAPASSRKLIRSKLYDGVGRYTLSRWDDVRAIQGLQTLSQRFGVKPYQNLAATRAAPEGSWQTERVFFRDLDTGALIVRLTNDPWAETTSYFGHNWSADGKCIVFRRNPGRYEPSTATHGPMAVNSDGTGLRNIFRDYKVVRKMVCSPVDPNLCFAVANTKQITAFDLSTARTHHVIREVPDCWHVKISPDGRRLLSVGETVQGGRGMWVVSVDGKEYHEFVLRERIHDSYRFHPTLNKLMFWYSYKFREGFVQCDFDGTEMSLVQVPFDWNHGDFGADRGAHTTGHIVRMQGDGWLEREPLFHAPGVEYYDMPHEYNGYVTWGPGGGLWVYASRVVGPPYLSEIQSFHAEPVAGDVVNRFRICHTGLWRSWCLDNPQASPDGTKVSFTSNMLGSVDVYYVVARLPERPQNVTADRTGNSIKLRWDPPSHHAEVAGYHVYRSNQSGVGFVPITAKPVRGLQFTDQEVLPDGPAYYAVTAVEHSGLESGLSDEAGVGDGATDHSIILEAERGQRDHSMWVAYEASASNLHHVWLRKDECKGQVVFYPDHPGKDKSWFVWARVKGDNGVRFTVGADKSIQLSAPPSSGWTWVRSDTPLNWTSTDVPSRRNDPGQSNQKKQASRPVRITSDLYGSSIDCLVLTTDASFSPENSPRIVWPGGGSPVGVSARAISPYSVKVSWSCDVPSTFHHFNLYRGRTTDFEIGQAALVASPDQTDHIDWGLQHGQTYYYRITWVDRAGNESPPSTPARVTTPGVERVTIEPPAGERISFQVPRGGEYVLWLELELGKGGGQYIDVQVDKQRQRMWCIVPDRARNVSWHTYGEWGRFQLEAGAHTLTLKNKTSHRVRRVLITSDHSFKPPGHVNILRGW